MATDTRANATSRLRDLGQSLWLDNITRGLLTSGGLRKYIDEWSVTGLTSNPTIFDHAIESGHFYDDAIGRKTREGTAGEALFLELALEDLTEAAALFRPVHDTTHGLDGWVSLEVSPLLANDTVSTIKEAAELHARAKLLHRFTHAGVDVAALGGQLQREGTQSFDESWSKLMRRLAAKSGALTQEGRSTGASS